MSPFQRLEAAVNALEENDPSASKKLISTSMSASKKLWDTAAAYLIDESPCSATAGLSSSQEHKTPPPGGLKIVDQ